MANSSAVPRSFWKAAYHVTGLRLHRSWSWKPEVSAVVARWNGMFIEAQDRRMAAHRATPTAVSPLCIPCGGAPGPHCLPDTSAAPHEASEGEYLAACAGKARGHPWDASAGEPALGRGRGPTRCICRTNLDTSLPVPQVSCQPRHQPATPRPHGLTRQSTFIRQNLREIPQCVNQTATQLTLFGLRVTMPLSWWP